jgi:AcrR family transcriptional regulator
MEAMYAYFYDDITGFLKNGYEKAINAAGSRETYIVLLRTIAEYYLRNMEAMVFSLVQVFNKKDNKSLRDEFHNRGICFSHPAFGERPARYPSKMQLTMTTLILCVAQFHHHDREDSRIPLTENLPEEQVRRVLLETENQVTKGLRLDAQKVAALDYEALEQLAVGIEYEDTETNTLLRAAAEAVGEAGPWNMTMEMVARRSGLSKSGLYAHFKNKQDMLAQLFITEFMNIVNFAKVQIEASSVLEDQLYLAIVSIVDYLRSRPEIFLALDWIKTGRFDLGIKFPLILKRTIKDINIKAIQKIDLQFLVRIAEWVLFMIVNTLALWPSNQAGESTGKSQSATLAKKAAEVPNESFRLLFRYIALGLEGLDT